jgi:hypothetical protein
MIADVRLRRRAPLLTGTEDDPDGVGAAVAHIADP